MPAKHDRCTKVHEFENGSKVKVFGSRSLKGWRVLLATTGAAEPSFVGNKDTKEEAEQYACDGAKETPRSFYHVRPN